MITRILLTGLVIAIAAFFTPGFAIENIWVLALATAIIVGVNYLLEKYTALSASPFGRGFSGFIISAIVLYATQFIIEGFELTIIGALLGALSIGVVDALIPGKQFNKAD